MRLIIRIAACFLASLAIVPAHAQTCASLGAPVFQSIHAEAESIAAADLNRDGRVDLAIAVASNRVTVLRQAYGQQFTPVDFALESRPRAIAIADLNGDLNPDIIVAHGNADVTTILLNQNLEQIGGQTVLDVSDNPNAIAVNDLDGDAKLDVVVSGFDGVALLRGNGDGTLESAATLFPAGEMPTGLAIADFDHDGRADLAVANFGASTISVMKHQATGALFGSPVATNAGSDPAGIATGDFNEDGWADLAVSNFAGGTISVLLNNAGTGFTPAATLSSEAGPMAIIVADLNSDNDADLAVANTTGGSVTLFPGNGDGTFDAGITQAVDALNWALTAGNLAASTQPDLAIGDGADSRMALVANECPNPPVAVGIGPGLGSEAGGRLAEIIGYNLQGATEVRIGGNAATIVSSSASAIVIQTPPGTGTQPVSVITNHGTWSGSNPKYVYKPQPSITTPPTGGSKQGMSGSADDYLTWLHFTVTEPESLGNAILSHAQFGTTHVPETDIAQIGTDVWVKVPPAATSGAVPVTFLYGEPALNFVDAQFAPLSWSYMYTNATPAATAATVSTDEDTPLNVTLTGSDSDGDPLTFEIVAQPSNGTLTGTPPNVVYYPHADTTGNDAFTFRVLDNENVPSATASVTIAVAPVNDAPVATEAIVTTNEDTATSLTLAATDTDGSAPITFEVTSNPAKGQLGGSAPNLTYTPNADATGLDTFTFVARDAGNATSSPATFTVAITPVNDAPVATAQSVGTTQTTPIDILLSGTDVDGDPLGFTITVPPQFGTLSGTGSSRRYTPYRNAPASDSFQFVVNDATTQSAPATVSISISAAALPAAIPTLDPRALITLAAMLAIVAAFAIRRG